ncbi:MAG: KamA family radical SAM protein [Deltaproteobacteria bacterium]|nr:KamA family radical SAM protein [Deltaproteobacteria bacterium]
MELWQKLLASAFRQPIQLSLFYPNLDVAALDEVAEVYPMCINPYYLSLAERPDDPIGRPCIPDPAELEPTTLLPDPLAEESTSPVPCVVHRYPDRALFLVTTRCAMYCRFCTRKRKVGKDQRITEEMRREGLDYIARTPEVRDVIVSGGDPLLLPDEVLEDILLGLRRIRHVEVIRIGTRVPCTLPHRVTRRLARMLRKYNPLFVNTHVDPPRELTAQAAVALGRLADAGIPLGNQSVLLHGVNDDPAVFLELNRRLLACRVRPYYLYQADLVEGTEHFRTPVETGLRVVRALRGHTSGLAVPQFVIDAPGGGGKIPLLPEDTVQRDGARMVLRNYRDELYVYPDETSRPEAPPLAAEPDCAGHLGLFTGC